MPDDPAIDIHFHMYATPQAAINAMGGRARVGYTGTPEEAIPFMAGANIDAAVMLNFTPVWDMAQAARRRWQGDLTPEAEERIRADLADRLQRRNQWSCEASREHPQLIPFIGVDPVLGDQMEAEVEARHREGARGIKLHPPVQHIAVNDRRLWPAYAAAERLGMIVLTHMGPFGDISGEYAHPKLFAEVAAAFPNLHAVLAHCGGREGRDAAIALAQERPNINFDCCGVVSPSPDSSDLDDQELVNLFRRLGTDRIAFGSDWCFRDPRPDIEHVLGLPFTDDEKRAILRGNAARWLGVQG